MDTTIGTSFTDYSFLEVCLTSCINMVSANSFLNLDGTRMMKNNTYEQKNYQEIANTSYYWEYTQQGN